MRILKLAIIISAVVLISSACSITTKDNFSKSGPDNDNSIFVSTNYGNNWKAMALLQGITNPPQTIANLNVNTMTMDPSDHYTVYLASFNQGLYYTNNIAQGWVKVNGLPTTTINAVKVDPKNKCTIYVALANRVYRSDDCTRSWKQIYFDNDSKLQVNTIVVDYYNPNNIYIGDSRGEIIKSIDRGNSWRTIKRLKNGVSRLVVSPLDSRLLFVATKNDKIYSFISNTVTNPSNSADIENNFVVESWLDLNDLLANYNLGNNFRDLVISAKDDVILLATDKVILRSPDGGVSWKKLNLIQPGDKAAINSVVIDPTNSNNIYYVSDTTFFRSSDGGVTWTTKKLPTKRVGRDLLIDFKKPNIIYLGTMKLKKQKYE